MLRIIEVSTAAEFATKYISGDTANDYMYFLKYANTILFTDNGTDKYFNSVQEVSATEYAALTTKQKTFYMVLQTDNSYKCYFDSTLITDTSLAHSHTNKDLLDKFSISESGVLLYNGSPVDDTTDNHTHTNKDLLDKLSSDTNGLTYNGNDVSHTHTNKSTIDKLTESSEGKLLFNGSLIEGTGGTGTGAAIDDTTTSTDTTYSSTKIEEEITALGSPVYVDPMDVKDEHIVGHAELTLSANKTAVIGQYVIFDTIQDLKGMTVNTSTGTITLEKDKSYNISLIAVTSDPNSSSSGYVNSLIYNKTDNVQIGKRTFSVDVAYSSPYFNSPTTNLKYTPTKDIEIGVYTQGLSNSNFVYRADVCVFSVQEIAQPVVTEYNKEISNPLTTTDISQESPVGSIINYVGSDSPTHYLPCSCIYNIADYQELANFIKNHFGSYNYFGGDGTTTFAVPSIDPLYINSTPVMTSNTTPSPYVASASSEYDSGYPAWHAFDNNITSGGNGWASTTTGTSWLKFDFGSPIPIDSVSMWPRSTFDNCSPASFTIQGSNDNTNFTVLKTVTGEYSWSDGVEKKYRLNNSVSYRYYRIYITANAGGPYLGIGEVKFYRRYSTPCIKYESTYYAVNQYGGFESKVLFDGIANTLDSTYTLLDNIEDYDFLVVNSHILDNSLKTQRLSNIIFPSRINYNQDTFLFNMTITSQNRRIMFSFPSANTFKITSIETTALAINSVIGFKGELPSLLGGGIA